MGSLNSSDMNLSILIPTFNDDCTSLVHDLLAQAELIDGLSVEVLIGDDGSTDENVVGRLHALSVLSHTQYIRREKNQGRAAIRNFLVRQAHYDRLLFIDSDMTVCRDDFLRKYLDTQGALVYGGYIVGGDSRRLRHNLRYQYERHCEAAHHVDQRLLHPDRDFHTSNFLVDRQVMLSHPLDERFRHYGYEDVLWGKVLTQEGFSIRHIDNPLSFATFEDNAAFVAKTEEGLHTLFIFRKDLSGYSHLLALSEKWNHSPIGAALRLWHKWVGPWERKKLCGTNPSVPLLQLYKLGFFLSLY